jgi:hypothetical protein
MLRAVIWKRPVIMPSRAAHSMLIHINAITGKDVVIQTMMLVN